MVIDALSDNIHSIFEISEKEALLLTFNKIKQHKYADNLTETLAKQLADSIENGHVVCSTGRITQIVETLDGSVDDFEKTRDINTIRNEIATLAGKIQAKEGNGTDFKNETRNIYIKDLHMSPDIIDKIIDEYIVGFE